MAGKGEKYAFVGSGIMGGVWIERMLSTAFVRPDEVLACDIDEGRLEEVKQKYGVNVSRDNREAPKFGDTLVIAVPPPQVLSVIGEVRDLVGMEHTIISVAASIPLIEMEKALGKDVSVIRIMPNTPSLVGLGMNPVCFGTHFPDKAKSKLSDLLDLMGKSIEVPDEMMNKMTALNAVGPTYVLPVIGALSSAATKMGIPPEDALFVAAQTVLGSAGMVLETGKSPDELKDMTGLQTLREADAKPIFEEAVDSAYQKLMKLQEKLVSRLDQ